MLKKTIKGVVLALILFVITLGLYTNHMKSQDPDWNLQVGDYKLMEVTYDGFGNQVKIGDMMLVHEKDAYDISEIIMYQNGTHQDVARIVDTTKYGVVPRKETSFINENFVPHGDIIGSLDLCIRGGMKWWSILTHPLTVGLLATAVFAYFLHKTSIRYTI
mgnify:FL=1